jgi:transposase
VKKIRRKTLKIATAPQMRLFEATEEPALQEPRARPGAVRFVDPDPRQIYLGGRRLDEYLQEAGQHGVVQLRCMLRALDWSGFEGSYTEEGRVPYAPVAMVSLIVDGLRALERRARTDLGCMWLCGGISPDHSSIGRFIVRHEQLLSQEFFEQLTAEVLRRCGGSLGELALDGTVVQAVASLAKTLKLEAALQRLEQAREAAAQRPEDPKLAKELAEAQRVAEVAQQRAAARKDKGREAEATRVSPSEPEAVVQPLKNAGSRPSYKPVLLANAQRLILAAAVEPSSETRPVAGLLEQAQRIGQRAEAEAAEAKAAEALTAKAEAAEAKAAEALTAKAEAAEAKDAEPTPETKVCTVLADAAFFTEEVISSMEERNIEFLCPQGSVQLSQSWDKGSKKFFPKSLFVYEPQTDSFRCPAAEQLRPTKHYGGSSKAKPYVLYSTPACAGCALRAQCTSSSKGRSLLRYPADARKDQLRARMKLPEVRARYRKRQAWVEPVFSSLKLGQGLLRFLRRGLKGVRVEFALHAMAHNLGRLLALSASSSGLCGALCALFAALLAAWSRSVLFQGLFAPDRRVSLHHTPHQLFAT